MNIDKKNASVNHQDHPHQEGQQNNTPSIQHRDGQRRSDNQNQPMSNMLNETEEQNARQEREDNDERDTRQNER